MKYGFLYEDHRLNDVYSLLYVLQDKKLVLDNTWPTFKFVDEQDEFIFSMDKEIVKDCDKKFLLNHGIDFSDRENIIYTTPGEDLPTWISDSVILDFLDKDNLIVSGSIISFDHKNYIYDFSFHLFFFYHSLGFNFLNYNFSDNRTNLVGMYYQAKHISGREITNRTRLFNQIENVLQGELVVYPLNTSKLAELTVPYTAFGLWDKTHISSYTDYITSVCTVIFETNSVTNSSIPDREHMTEKTLKSLLFSKCKIFTMLFCSPIQYRYLIDKGFWMFNFEFIKEDPTNEDILKSIVAGTEYIKELFDTLKTYNAVYQHLLEKYGHHLEKNGYLISKLLDECPDEPKKKLLDYIRK